MVLAHLALKPCSLEKDVDGFSPENIGQLAMRGRTPRFVPCTPKVNTVAAQVMSLRV